MERSRTNLPTRTRAKPRSAGSNGRRPAAAMTRTKLQTLSDDELLRMRICDLPVAELPTGNLARQIDLFYAELAAAGLRYFRPHVYIGDEWFSPAGVPSIALPFYLTHPRLKSLERRMMASVEGGSAAWLLRLLRHEAGHCFDHAYGVSKTRAWRQMFGDPNRPYHPDVYLPDPRSRDFVQHLDNFYAQAHPDEDFAETFAVVIAPGSAWRERYRAWPGALAKLNYVATLIASHGPRQPRLQETCSAFAARRMRMTLARYYEKRRAAEHAYRMAQARLARRVGLPAAGET